MPGGYRSGGSDVDPSPEDGLHQLFRHYLDDQIASTDSIDEIDGF